MTRQLEYLDLVIHLGLIDGLRCEEVFIVVLRVYGLDVFYSLNRLEARTRGLFHILCIQVDDLYLLFGLFLNLILEEFDLGTHHSV